MTTTQGEVEQESETAHNRAEFVRQSIMLLVEEYKTLRQESLDSIKTRTQIVSFGLASVVFLMGAPLSAISKGIDLNYILAFSAFFILAYNLVIPIVCVTIVSLWLGEYRRQERAGRFLHFMESRINKALSETLPNSQRQHILSWESWLRERVHAANLWPANPFVTVATNDLKEAEPSNPALGIWLVVRVRDLIAIKRITRKIRKIRGAYRSTIDLFFILAYLSNLIGIAFYLVTAYIALNGCFSRPCLIKNAPALLPFLLVIIICMIKLSLSYRDMDEEYAEIRKETYQIP